MIIGVPRECEVHVIEGDIAEVRADALITAINSGGEWHGGIDGVIRRCAGEMFHEQARQQLPFGRRGVIIAQKRANHIGAFTNVVFVGDDLQFGLRHVVSAGLRGANEEGYETVSMPAIRTGVMLGAYEKTVESTVGQIALGMRDFFGHDDTRRLRIKKITVVTYRDPSVYKALAAIQGYELGG
jgi:O-acetyl-ADP-ribose deacetylase (regulator of RNase III)